MNELDALAGLATVISHSAAPAFLLGALATLTSVLLSRTEAVTARMRSLNATDQAERIKAYPDQDMKRLARRMALLHMSILFGLGAMVAAVVLVVVSFLYGMLGSSHVYIMSIMFVLTLSLMFASIALFMEEVRIALKSFTEANENA